MTTPHNPHPSRETEPLAEKIIDRIEQEHVTPKPRWQFDLLNRALWTLWGASLLFAVIAAGAMIFALANADWAFRSVTHDNVVSYLFDILPFFWVALITLMLFLAYETVKRTKWGYRYPVYTIAGLGTIGILLGGGVLFASGLGQDLEREIGARVPLYRPMMEQQRRMWVNPSRGLLAGEILRADEGYATFTVRTFDGSEWIVNGDDLRDRDRQELASRRAVRLVGVPPEDKDDASVFHACFVFPWNIRDRLPDDSLKNGVLPPQDLSGVRKLTGERSTECRGVRPYAVLKAMRQEP